MASFDDSRGDGGNLRRCLAQSEDDLGKALTRGAVVIDLGEPEVGERLGTQRRQQRPVGIVRRSAAVADLIEKNTELVWAHHRSIVPVLLTLEASKVQCLFELA